MFLVVLEICDYISMDGWEVSGWMFLSYLWSEILAYIIALLSHSIKDSSIDLRLNLLLIEEKDNVSQDFNKSKKIEYCQ